MGGLSDTGGVTIATACGLSVTGCEGAVTGGVAVEIGAGITAAGAPQFLQNFFPDSLGKPHFRQDAVFAGMA